MEIRFLYSIGDRVKITDLDRCGYVTGLYYTETGKQYQVSYFHEGDLKTNYLLESQISESTESKNESVFCIGAK
jgi:hypothetical protein